jgi:ABC-2 type transport system permease protein
MNATVSTTRIYWLELKSEFLKMLRLPAYAIPTITFPLIFYVLFGLALVKNGKPGGISMAAYMIATYGAFGVIGASLFGFGVAVATERGQGWLQVKRASPMPIGAWFAAKVGMSLLFGAIIVSGLCLLGATLGHVQLPASAWLQLFVTLVLGSIPFCAFGLAIGYSVGPNSAPAIVNLIHLPMSVISGLWMPIQILPKVLQKIAVFLPPYHLSQLALAPLGASRGTIASHVVALASFTVLFLFLAVIAYRRDEGKLYG